MLSSDQVRAYLGKTRKNRGQTGSQILQDLAGTTRVLHAQTCVSNALADPHLRVSPELVFSPRSKGLEPAPGLPAL